MNQFGPNPPATSGSYNFAPSLGELGLYAYGLCGIRRTALTQQHMEDLRISTSLLMGRWSSQGVNLWQVDLICVPLQQGCATYAVPNNTIAILDAYYTIGTGTSALDRIMLPISRSEYASYSNKYVQGTPSVYWFDRLLNPTITLYQVPNGSQVALKYYRLRQTQDSVLSNATQLEVPVYFLDAAALGIAARLAMIYAQDKAPMLKAAADEAWTIASTQNVETNNLYVTPVISNYFR